MKRLSISLMALGLLAAPALAQEAVVVDTMPVVVDTDGNGTYSVEEMRVIWVDMTDDQYKIVDVDADGSISQDELKSAWEEGSVLKENKNGNADEKAEPETGSGG